MKIIDHTLTISDKIPTFPGSPGPHFIDWETIEKDGYNLELLFLSSHTGTHIDAPFHFIKNGKKIHEIPPERLVNEAVLIKIRKKSNQAIVKNDIQKFEKKYGPIKSGTAVIFWTGWQKNLEKEFYFSENPGLTSSAAALSSSQPIKISNPKTNNSFFIIISLSKSTHHHLYKQKTPRMWGLGGIILM